MLPYNIGAILMATLTFALTVQALAVPDINNVEKRQCLGGSHGECVPLAATLCQLGCKSRNAIQLTVCMEQCSVKAGEQCINDC